MSASLVAADMLDHDISLAVAALENSASTGHIIRRTHMLVAGASCLSVAQQAAELLLGLCSPRQDPFGRRELPVQACVRHPHDVHLHRRARSGLVQLLSVHTLKIAGQRTETGPVKQLVTDLPTSFFVAIRSVRDSSSSPASRAAASLPRTG